MGGDRLGSAGDDLRTQVNYADYLSNMYGRLPGLRHRYVIEGSLDGQSYYFTIEAFNENGISEPARLVEAK